AVSTDSCLERTAFIVALILSDISAIFWFLLRMTSAWTASAFRLISAILFAVSEAIASCWVRTLCCRVPAEVLSFIRTRLLYLAEADLDDGVLPHYRLDYEVCRR